MTSEAAIQSLSIYESSNLGLLPMRNNVGACVDETGRVIRYGLMNESKKVNDEFKSSDIIAITPILIEPRHVGRIMGIFTALETKESGWKMKPSDERAKAQLRFHNLVRTYGGIADFVKDPATIKKLIGEFL